MKRKALCVIFCFVMTGSSLMAYGEETSAKEVLNISLDDAIRMALETSEDLKLQDNEVRRKDSEQREERAPMLPQVMAESEWSKNFEYPAAAAAAGTKDYHLSAGVTVTQTLFAFGRMTNAVAAANRDLEASRFDREGMKQAVIYNTKISFYNACLARRVLSIAQESYENVLRNKEILETRSADGRVSKQDNIKISSDIAARKPVVNNARADFLSAMETLKVAVGVGFDTDLELAKKTRKEYPEFERQNLAMALYHNQPAIKSLARDIDAKEALIQSKRAEFFPEISAFATWTHKGDGNNYYVGEKNLYDYGVAGLKVSVPIWLGGLNREKLNQAKIDKQDAELKYKQGEKAYLLMLDKALNEYQEYKKTLLADNEALSLAQESFRYSQELFGSGQVSATELNDAELQLTNAKLNKELTVFNLNKSLALIERLTLVGYDND